MDVPKAKDMIAKSEDIMVIEDFMFSLGCGRDYRFYDLPYDEQGNKMTDILSLDDPRFDLYLNWLADYLLTIDAEPDESQITAVQISWGGF